MSVTKAQLTAGLMLAFAGYADGEPADGIIIPVGAELKYVSHEVGEDSELDIVCEMANPKYDKAKRPNAKTNAKTVLVNVWDDEVKVAGEEAPVSTRTKGKGKTAAKTAEKPAGKGKAATKGKPAAKTSTKADTQAAAVKEAAKEKAAKEKAAAKEAAAKAKAEADKYVPEWEPLKDEDTEIAEIVAASEDLVDLAIDTIEDRGALDYRLGGILYNLARSGAFMDHGEEGKYAGKSGFKNFCDEVLEVGSRKAYYLINIYVQFNKLGIAGNVVAEIGWTKAKSIAETSAMAEKDPEIKFNKTEANKLVKLARKGDTTVRSLDDHIKETYRSGATPTEKFTTIKCSMPATRGSALLEIIETAKEQFGIDDTSEAVARIIEDWGQELAGS